MCKWRIAANHRVSINSKKPLREAFPLPADRSILRANAWKACGGRSGGGGGVVYSRKPLIDPLALSHVILSCLNFRAG